MRAERTQAKQDRAVRTRRAILEAAAVVFEERGYGAAKLTDIVELANVTKGALYFHFDSKEDLAQAVIDAQVIMHAPVTPQEFRAQEFVDVGMVFSHRLRYDVLMRGSARLTLEQNGRELDRAAPYQGWIDLHTALLVRAKEHGELLPHVDPAGPSRLVVGSFAGLNVMSQTLGLDLDREISALYTSVLPSLVVPAVAARLDTAPGRGARVLHGTDEAPGCDCSSPSAPVPAGVG
ncbi:MULTISPECIES: ScbR family autoregulator-binding transcription factor [Streptomyces]|uniref:TetR/AcrR family transcriptional regulator n=1 Tax=Streptomyces virginiae TaxID=1961 RepID=A0ABZ1TEH7_STRVG|nr:ScbR family autoregulator-binding transcription factor [Streptomyces virginiae]WTB23495.1 TetR/AcrR family transcriptional regulator [Streptomyces virginiae]